MSKQATSMRMPRELLERLKGIQSKTGMSRNDILTDALRIYLAILERGMIVAPHPHLTAVPDSAATIASGPDSRSLFSE